MADILEYLKVLFLGIVEGITEWLPVSSTGHMLLVDEFLQLKQTEAFKELFFVVIQLGAIMAVVLLFWEKMLPVTLHKKEKPTLRKDVVSLWFKVVVACIPGALAVFLFDDLVDRYLHLPVVIAAALIVYGFGFLAVEKWNEKRPARVTALSELSYKDAVLIGLFQVLSIIPGTSRSGSTIIGALLLGIPRTVAAEFTFFLAVPVMFGYSLLKLIKIGFGFTARQWLLLLAGCLAAYLTSLAVIRFLMAFIKKHSFFAFGIYRIILGTAVILYFTFV